MEQQFNYNDFSEYSGNEPEQQKKNRKKCPSAVKITALILAVAVIAGVGGGMIAASYLNKEDKASVTHTMSYETDNAATQGAASAAAPVVVDSTPLNTKSNSGEKNMTPSEVYSNYVDAVVSISVESTVTNVFGQVSSSASSGSGFLITEDGYVVTNYHVIEDGTHITVTLYDGTNYDASVVGYDSSNDVALLKIEASGLNSISIGDSDLIRVGEQVCAIGNPLGELAFTLTVGYVSALDREINTDGAPINMFQTDAAINPGNSGGPLFDMAGNVIGITTAKYASDEIEGLGFIIPINDVMDIVNDLKMYGRVVGRPYMGVSVTDMANSSMYNLPEGAYIYSVVEGGAADNAGIIAGDIVTAIGDRQITCYSDLVSALRDYEAGDTVSITVFQSGAYKDLTITFDEKPADTTTSSTMEESTQTIPGSGSQSGEMPSMPGYGYDYGYGGNGFGG